MGDWKDARFGVEGLDLLLDASTATEVVGEVFRRFAGEASILWCMEWNVMIRRYMRALSTVVLYN